MDRGVGRALNRLARRGGLPLAAAAVLLASLATLALLFLRAADQAAWHFRRAGLSQAQFADVLAIRAAAGADDATDVAAALRRYRADIAAETRLLAPAERTRQQPEVRAADAMARLAAAHPPRLDALSRLVALVAARERAEAAGTARAMALLRARSRFYALLLAGGAALSALIGAAGLLAANRRLARAVADRTARIEEVDRSRRLFFAKVSHELRTPVTVMRGEAEVALATARGDPPALAAALDEVVAQSEQLDRRIGELLALSQAADGRLVLEAAPLDLAEVLGRALARSARHAALHEVALAPLEVAPTPIRGDPRWLEQALIAVLDNAVKFSPAGGEVAVTLASRGGEAELVVADRGCGALPEAWPRLFDAYYQTDEGRARGGSGLGLALVRWTVERHGGRVGARPREGGGCVVAITLPVAR